MLERAEIISSEAAAVFGSARQRKILLSLIAKDGSLSDLAQVTALPLNLLHYHVGKLVRLGLVEITSRRKRAGTPISLYRAKARVFFVPAALSKTLPGEEMSQRLRAALENGLAGAIKGVEYTHDGHGPKMKPVRHEGGSQMAVAYWFELRLEDADAGALAAELGAMLARFRKRKTTRGRNFIVHAALAPLPRN